MEDKRGNKNKSKWQIFKEAVKNIDYRTIVLPCIYLVVGIFFVSSHESSIEIVCYILGALLVVAGIIRFCFSFVVQQLWRLSEIIISCAIIAVGVLLLIAPGFIANLIYTMFGLMLIVDAVLKAEESIEAKKANYKMWWTGMGIAVICFIFGIVIIINPFNARMLMIFIGVTMIADAVCSFVAAYARSVVELRILDEGEYSFGPFCDDVYGRGTGYAGEVNSNDRDDEPGPNDDDDDDGESSHGKHVIDI